MPGTFYVAPTPKTIGVGKTSRIDPGTIDPTITGAVPDDWQDDPIVSPAPPDNWQSDPIVGADGQSTLDPTKIDSSVNAPALVRVQVGALDKPDDRLAAVRKYYPDAQPYGSDNFIMTDPDTTKTILYKQDGLRVPSFGDIASITPEIGEGVGGILGGIGGAAGGSAVAPGPGTVAGGVLGAGAGATAGREAVQRGINWFDGNQDTRTTGQQLADAGKTFAANAAGEGAGMAIGAGAGALMRGARGIVSKGATTADDVAQAAQRAADARAIGVEPTAGMVNGNRNTAKLEFALGTTPGGQQIQNRIDQAFVAPTTEANRIVAGITPEAMSKQELGTALQQQAQNARQAMQDNHDALWQRVGNLTGDSPAQGTATQDLVDQLRQERLGLSNSDALNHGAGYDDIIRQGQAVAQDIGDGVNFNQLKDARTNIGTLANDPNIAPILRNRANQLYNAVTQDMGDTASAANPSALQAWQKANNATRRMYQQGSVFNPQSALDPIINAKTPEAAADWVLAQAKNGGTRLNMVRRQIGRTGGGDDAWASLVGSTVNRLGRSVGADGVETVSPAKFISDWGSISPEARQAMFRGTPHAQYADDLDQLARYSDNLRNYGRGQNFSNTAAAANNTRPIKPFESAALVGALFHNPMAGAAVIGGKVADAGANALYRRWQVRILSDPQTVNVLANLPRAQMQRGGVARSMAALGNIANSTRDPILSTAIDQLLLKNQDQSQNQNQ